MNNIYLIEDHDEALKVWKQKKLKGLDLVHLDAHIDFGLPKSKPFKKIIREAKSLKELKKELERSIAFMRYETDFNKQTSIGNFIYPAMEEGIVNNFYWVIPGGMNEFKGESKNIKNILKSILRKILSRTEIRKQLSKETEKRRISIKVRGRNLIVCTLRSLPVFKQNILLDIDTDFLVIDSLRNANNNVKIGKRKPWILPWDLVKMLKKKIKKPKVITISYSVNGGWTPIKYKHLADEIAYNFTPQKFKNRFRINFKAAEYFNLFNSTSKNEFYQKAVKLNPTYRVADNNYGPLYLSLRKFTLAENEFLRILKADSKNIACILGLGKIALDRKQFRKAKKYFSIVLNSKEHKLFGKAKNQGLLGLAKAEFNLKNFNKAKELLFRYQVVEPMKPESYYLLARIYEREKELEGAVKFYKDALILGFNDDLDVIWRLLKISKHFKEKKDLINYVISKYRDTKRTFTRGKRMNFKKIKHIKILPKIKKKMIDIEKMLKAYKV